MIIVYLIGKAMNNKTKAAIEEAAKLPTEEETLNTVVGDGCNFRKLFGDNDTDWVIKALESHTAAHTERLREKLRIETQKAKAFGHALDIAAKDELALKERVKELEVKNDLFEKYFMSEIEYLVSIDRTERGNGSLNALINIKEHWEALK